MKKNLRENFAMFNLLLLPLVLLHTTHSLETDLVIFWVSEPVLPGENAMIAFASTPVSIFAPQIEIFGRQIEPSIMTKKHNKHNQQKQHHDAPFTALQVQGATEYGITATIPSNYKIGEFELQIKRGNVTGPIYRANVPRPW